jgi:hypothetical protein
MIALYYYNKTRLKHTSMDPEILYVMKEVCTKRNQLSNVYVWKGFFQPYAMSRSLF